MENTKIAALSALLCIGLSGTALGQRGDRPQNRWDMLGSVRVGAVRVDGPRGPGPGPVPGPRMDRDVQNFDLGGPVERLQFRPEGSDINCRSVMAHFGNGRTRQIFQGRLRQGRETQIDLPGAARNLDRLIFTCASLDQRDAVIRISADVGRYRNDWMSGPNWSRTWSRLFNWGSATANNWQLIGHETFQGRGDTEMTFAGARGRRVDTIALMPVNADARCGRVEAAFDNGRRRTLVLRNGDLLRRGTYNQIDLPGDYRNLDNLYLRCRAVDASNVDIQVFVSH